MAFMKIVAELILHVIFPNFTKGYILNILSIYRYINKIIHKIGRYNLQIFGRGVTFHFLSYNPPPPLSNKKSFFYILVPSANLLQFNNKEKSCQDIYS